MLSLTAKEFEEHGMQIRRNKMPTLWESNTGTKGKQKSEKHLEENIRMAEMS